MDYKVAYIKLYGACGAAIEEIESLNFGQCKVNLQKAISAAEEIIFADSDEPIAETK